jgi:hypothetical protein
VENNLLQQTFNPRNTLACIFWLCNRSHGKWKNVNRIEVSGPDGTPIKMFGKDAPVEDV